MSPVKDALVAEALAWTPGTNGVVSGQAVQMTLPQRPTRDVLTAHLEPLKDVGQGQDGAGRRAAAGARHVQSAGAAA